MTYPEERIWSRLFFLVFASVDDGGAGLQRADHRAAHFILVGAVQGEVQLRAQQFAATHCFGRPMGGPTLALGFAPRGWQHVAPEYGGGGEPDDGAIAGRIRLCVAYPVQAMA